ncbi:hypothetical protein BDZ89DRAFT_252946 [Hymenopellis radicata]|nr:hypothetical protein BDZ89DRAFT_252946 [Hymenopellis radicata]
MKLWPTASLAARADGRKEQTATSTAHDTVESPHHIPTTSHTKFMPSRTQTVYVGSEALRDELRNLGAASGGKYDAGGRCCSREHFLDVRPA